MSRGRPVRSDRSNAPPSSSTATLAPASASARATGAPPAPEPTTQTSTSISGTGSPQERSGGVAEQGGDARVAVVAHRGARAQRLDGGAAATAFHALQDGEAVGGREPAPAPAVGPPRARLERKQGGPHGEAVDRRA